LLALLLPLAPTWKRSPEPTDPLSCLSRLKPNQSKLTYRACWSACLPTYPGRRAECAEKRSHRSRL